MSSHASLDAAAQERKARLAKLKNLKRKAPDSSEEQTLDSLPDAQTTNATSADPTPASNPYLSGRNYDSTTRTAKLGFEHNPSADQDTAERRAQELADQERAEREAEAREEAEKGEAARALDLFKLQPKKPNWDLKRDMERRMEVLNVRTENAIARAVRERIAAQKKTQLGGGQEGDGVDGGAEQAAGFKGEELVSALHAKERMEEEEERREREEDEEEEEGFK